MSNAILNPHGGDIYKASEQYGIRREDFLDFSANINPLGIPSELRELIISNIDNLVNYPEPQCESLRKHISTYLNTPAEKIIIGNGASEIIFLLFDILKPKKVLIPAPSFSEYSQAAERYGAEVEYVELLEQDNYKLDIDVLISKMSCDINAILLCNPNNPTSTLISRSDILRIVEYAKAMDICVIIDEAFIELTEGGNDNSLIKNIDEFSNLFIIRAFTKVFAIPGMRLGYGIGDAEIIKRMWEKKLPWSVNSFACSFGDFLSKAEVYLSKTALWISEERKWFFNELKKMANLKVFEPNTNFVLLKIDNSYLTAGALRDLMAKKGVLIRDASNFKFLNEQFFRLAIKDRASNMIVLETLKDVLEGKDKDFSL